MSDPTKSPLPIKGLATPLLRPLPAVFSYASHSDGNGYQDSAAARSLFTAHLRAFRVILVALARSAALPDQAIRRMTNRCEDLAGAAFWELSNHVAAFKAELLRLHEEHGEALKTASREESGRMRNLFRVETGPCKLLSLHNNQTWPRADALRTKLVDGCWYDCVPRHEETGTGPLEDIDLVLLVPGDTYLRQDIEAVLDKTDRPVLVLVGGGPASDWKNMAFLRAVNHYRETGYAILSGPQAPIRLYQAIDGCRVRRMLGQESFSPGAAEMVAP